MKQQPEVALMDQQFWCWGQDIVHPAGNLLLQFGFERTAAVADSKHHSLYRLPFEPAGELVLRGFGLFFGVRPWGGIFLKRCEGDPRYCRTETLPRLLWQTIDLPELEPVSENNQQAVHLLQHGLFRWIATYENWIAQTVGTEYRQSSLQRWREKRKPVLPADHMAAEWENLAKRSA
jgi:hypothetical protein